MGGKLFTCKIYIVFQHALFAQGIRSLLRGRRSMRVVGMESDPGKALEALRSPRADVIIVEDSLASAQSSTLRAILQSHRAGRVVALDLDYNFATVYDKHRVVTTQPADLVRAIRGFARDPGDPAPKRPGRASRAHSARDQIRVVSLERRHRQR